MLSPALKAFFFIKRVHSGKKIIRKKGERGGGEEKGEIKEKRGKGKGGKRIKRRKSRREEGYRGYFQLLNTTLFVHTVVML